MPFICRGWLTVHKNSFKLDVWDPKSILIAYTTWIVHPDTQKKKADWFPFCLPSLSSVLWISCTSFAGKKKLDLWRPLFSAPSNPIFSSFSVVQLMEPFHPNSPASSPFSLCYLYLKVPFISTCPVTRATLWYGTSLSCFNTAILVILFSPCEMPINKFTVTCLYICLSAEFDRAAFADLLGDVADRVVDELFHFAWWWSK